MGARGLIVCLGLLALVGCEEAKPDQAVVESWKERGLTSTPFETTQAMARECRRGAVEGIEVTLCEFDTVEAAVEARERGYEIIGESTGATLVKDKIVMVVVDRGKVDPSGRTMNKVTKAFLGDGPETAGSAKPVGETREPSDGK